MYQGRIVGKLLVVGAMLAAMGCSSTSGPSAGGSQATGTYNVSANAETVPVWNDGAISMSLASEINLYRSQAGLSLFPLIPSNILYTVAVRHAGYLDSVNSVNGLVGPDTGTMTVESDVLELYGEPNIPVAPNVTPPVLSAVDGTFPIYYTHNDLRRRVLAVVGGPDLLAIRSGTRNVFECYLISNAAELINNVTTPGTPVLSNFRGLGSLGNLATARNYTSGQNLWYNPAWRVVLMRASTRWLGFGTVADARNRAGFQPPYPVLSSNGPQAFGGVVTLVEEASPAPVVFPGIWPQNGNLAVQPFGFDGAQGDVVYPWLSGPPMHVILPTVEWVQNLTVTFHRSTAGGAAQAGAIILDPATNTTYAAPTSGGNPANNVYVFGNTVNVVAPGPAADNNGDGYFTPLPGADLFYGTAGPAGLGGSGSISTETFHSNLGIVYIDNFTDFASAYHVDNLLIDFAYYTLGAPSRELTTIQFESALDAQVAVGDTITIGQYVEPLMVDNPGSENNIFGHNDGNLTIVWISASRTVVQVSTRPSGYDEVAASSYNLHADPGPNTNANCNVTGLRTSSGGGNALATIRNGEFLMIPGDPLIPGVYYHLDVTAQTITGLIFNYVSTFQVN